MFLSRCQQSHLKLSVRDHRQIQSNLRGHPLIGQAKLTPDELVIGEPHQKEMVITRDGKERGKLALEVHLVPLAPTALLVERIHQHSGHGSYSKARRVDVSL